MHVLLITAIMLHQTHADSKPTIFVEKPQEGRRRDVPQHTEAAIK